MTSAEKIIRMEYGNSRNFMTPTVLEYGMLSATRAYEISKGSGIFSGVIYGLSIVDFDPENNTTKRSDDSGMFYTMDEIRARILELGGYYNA